MTHFGIFCPATTGHLNTMLPLGKELQRRGHKVTLVGLLDAKAPTLAAGIEFSAIGEAEFPPGSMTESLTRLAELSGREALQYTIQILSSRASVLLRDGPEKIKERGIEALLVDQVVPEAGTVADFLKIPFISICSAVVINREPGIPPIFTNWPYTPSLTGQIRNQVGYLGLSRLTNPITKLINDYRAQWQLPRQNSPNKRYSRLAQISHQPAELEFPRKQLPPYFHFTGPFHSLVGRRVADFPYEKLTGQPLIYASMGSVLGSKMEIFKCIAEASSGLDAQLVISLGGSAKPESLPDLSGNPLVVEYAPQLDLLQKATLTITHAGLNTTLESLTQGVPMVAIPIANDQPGVASRIVWSGCGEAIPLKKLNVPRLKTAIQKVLSEDSYKRNALRLQTAIATSGGVKRAADIIEEAITTGKPVLAKPEKT